MTAYDERFTFTGKERDAETGYLHFDARNFSDILGNWLSVDPLADKFIDKTPYLYCEGNPILLIDPDGNACKISVFCGTITIRATYYVSKKDYSSALKAIGFWNSQKDLKYVSKEGKTYSVRFRLDVRKSYDLSNDATNDEVGNSYRVVATIGKNKNGDIVTGRVKDNKNIEVANNYKFSTTGAHEVGHTLMNNGNQDDEHTMDGIMTEASNDPNRSESVSQETVNNIVETNGFDQKNKSLWQRILDLLK